MPWFALSNGKEVGPLSSAQLKELAAKGKLGRSVMLRRENDANWVAAGSVPGLFPEPAAATAAAPARQAAGQPVPQPATRRPIATAVAQPAPQVSPAWDQDSTPTVVPAAPRSPSKPAAPQKTLLGASDEAISCKVCDAGTLQKKKVYRMSGVVAVIGWIFLVPSFFGMAVGILMMTACSTAGVKAHADTTKRIRNDLEAAAIPTAIVEKVMRADAVTTEEMSAITDPAKKELIQKSEIEVRAAVLAGGTVMAGGALFGGVFIFLSFVGGLLGWILTMKKRVLKCNSCEAIVAAS